MRLLALAISPVVRDVMTVFGVLSPQTDTQSAEGPMHSPGLEGDRVLHLTGGAASQQYRYPHHNEGKTTCVRSRQPC